MTMKLSEMAECFESTDFPVGEHVICVNGDSNVIARVTQKRIIKTRRALKKRIRFESASGDLSLSFVQIIALKEWLNKQFNYQKESR